jgi:hypothetical protein
VTLSGEELASGALRNDCDIQVEIDYQQAKRIVGVRVSLHIATTSNELVFGTTDESVRDDASFQPGRYLTRCRIPANLLNRRDYGLTIKAGIARQHLLLSLDVGHFTVDGAPNDGSLVGGPGKRGAVSPKIDWELLRLDREVDAAAGARNAASRVA